MRTPRRIIFTLVCAVLVALMLAACGDDDSSNATIAPTATRAVGDATSTPDEADEDNDGDGSGNQLKACSLLTREEVEAVIGIYFNHDRTDTGSDLSCFWLSADEEREVWIHAYVADSEEGARVMYEATDGEPVDGVGDEAKWTGSDPWLEVLQDNYHMRFRLFQNPDVTDEEWMAQAEDLARKALARLP